MVRREIRSQEARRREVRRQEARRREVRRKEIRRRIRSHRPINNEDTLRRIANLSQQDTTDLFTAQFFNGSSFN
ncbi:hypothetical protein RclHR1_00110006 [Rhizophagus clarus]|uniref:Uncharacterized protein n=1 Tax=Rhizophagus clarus TaxID=94130 RepID=A0A2Z6Q2Z9_9GLOM|nr:hypothetical protein RclHR1_00110006 [Rhizophagus clarus]GES98020.1 hypothetical protein RCL_jg16284.t1 [Rhizophagus clarus]